MTDDQTDAPGKPHYTWPWFVLAVVVLGIVLAIVWVSIAVHKLREQRDLTYPTTNRMSM